MHGVCQPQRREILTSSAKNFSHSAKGTSHICRVVRRTFRTQQCRFAVLRWAQRLHGWQYVALRDATARAARRLARSLIDYGAATADTEDDWERLVASCGAWLLDVDQWRELRHELQRIDAPEEASQ